MEASVDLSSPKKAPRRHYKAEFEKMCAYADELVADLQDTKKDRMYAEDEARRQIKRADRWAIAATVEFVALIIIVVFLR